MTISADYLSLLDHLGETRPVADLLTDQPNVVALRHDVDHDLDLALEMAFWEHRRGVRATYYLLPSAPYWGDDKDFDLKVLQLADYGHEVGLHLNGLAEWVDGRIDDIPNRLQFSLARLRSSGLDVIGTAAHGDRACYEHDVINNWVFEELRPTDPSTSESGLSAEGVPSPDPAFRIPYRDDVVTRADGAQFRLWSLSMADMGLAYEAVRLSMDGYYSDSGGRWTRTPDPLTADLSRGRHQVLVHPEYYRGPQRTVFVLSTARSGSAWTARALQRCSSATAHHEFTLNHRLDDAGEVQAEHRTGAGFTKLLQDSGEVRRLVAQAREIRERRDGDHVECNVYLPHALNAVRDVHPDATLIHLYRDPHRVLPSLLNRDWYDTPLDDRHPSIEVDGWASMDQVEKCCAYITATNIDLALACDLTLSFEQALTDPDHLVDVMAQARVAVHRRLLDRVVDDVVNAGRVHRVGPLDDWPHPQRLRAAKWLGQVRRMLAHLQPFPRMDDSPESAALPEDLVTEVLRGQLPGRANAVGGDLLFGPPGALRTNPDRHSYVLLGGGVWGSNVPSDGWEVVPNAYVSVRLHTVLDPPTPATLFGLSYDEDGQLLQARRLAPLGSGIVDSAFRPRPDGARWNLGIHVPATSDSTPRLLTINAVEVDLHITQPLS